ncbi:hypothetical protein JTB14_010339 [Gonioctena quinquepunctata]|nr:hypothetical protein JTB14_010339 [Gonioctena quinquepunctata]
MDTKRSTGGYPFNVCKGEVSWASRRQQSVSLSTTEAAYVVASGAIKEAIWIPLLPRDIGEKTSSPTILYIDNQSAVRLIRNSGFHRRTKHLYTI